MTPFLADLIDLAAGVRRARIDENPDGVMFSSGENIGRRLYAEVYGAREADWDATVAYISGLAPRLAEAHVFRFENIPYRPIEGEDGFSGPVADEEAVALFNAGRLRLPFPVCWFEYRSATEGMLYGLLVEERGSERWEVWAFDEDDTRKGNGRRVLGFCCASVRLERIADEKAAAEVERGDGLTGSFRDDVCSVVVDPLGHWEGPAWVFPRERLRYLFALYLAGELAAPDKSIEVVAPSMIENMRRSKRGATRLRPYSKVTLKGEGTAPS